MLENQSSLIEKFWKFNEDNILSSSAILIYLFLLKEVFSKNSLRLNISDVYLSKQLGVTRKTVKSNKEILQSRGLIKFEIKNGVGCCYEILIDYQFSQSNVEKIFNEEISLKLNSIGNSEFSEENGKLPTEDQIKKSERIGIHHSSKIKTIQNKKDFPSLREFLEFAQTLEIYKENLEESVIEKYHEWIKNEWKNKFDRPITNWKSVLKNVLPYLEKDLKSTKLSIQNIPNIRRINIEDQK